MSINERLEWIFTNIFYPIVVTGVFAFIIYSIVIMIKDARETLGRIRRLTAASLPLITLIFIIVAAETPEGIQIKEFILSLHWLFRFFIGVMIGIEVMEMGIWYSKFENDTEVSIYLLFLSSIGTFILYLIMKGALGSLQLVLFGMVLAGGLMIIFRDMPQQIKNKAKSKNLIIIIFIMNLGITVGAFLLRDLIIEKKITPKKEEIKTVIKEEDKKEDKKKGIITEIQKEEADRSEMTKNLNMKEEIFVNLIESSINSDEDKVYYDSFMRAITELKEMGSDHKIPISLMMKILTISYPNAREGSHYYEYREISIKVIDFFVRIKAKEACKLLYQIQARGGVLFDAAKEAAKKICGY